MSKRSGAQRLSRYARKGRQRIQAYLLAEFKPHEANVEAACIEAMMTGYSGIRFYEQDGAIRSEVLHIGVDPTIPGTDITVMRVRNLLPDNGIRWEP